jgi:transcription elongation GreA/GreB family factor
MNQRPYLTPGGHRRLRARLGAFRARYKAICDDNPAALESGDSSGWHDNFAFEENQRQMHQLAYRVRELERLLEQVELVPPLDDAPARVVVGTAVVYQQHDEDEPRHCWIAGWNDGAPASGRVSYNSPLGRALMGARVGDERELRLPDGVRWLEVLELGPTPEDGEVDS